MHGSVPVLPEKTLKFRESPHLNLGRRKGHFSFDGDEFGSLGGSMTDLTVTNWFVSHGELSEVVTNHVSFDFDWVPILSGVHFAN